MKAKWTVLLNIMLLSLISGCLQLGIDTTSPDEGVAGPPRQTIRLLYATNEAGSEAIIAAAEQYKLKTGIDIEVSTLPYNNLQGKVFSELAQKSGYYDLMAVDTPWMPKIIQHLEPMSSYIQNTKSPAAIQLDDFIAKVFLDTSVFKQDSPQQAPPQLNTISLKAITSAGFDVWSLPIQSNALTVSYRKDLFNDPNYKEQFQNIYHRELTIPQTLDEYVNVAKFFTRDTDRDGKPDLYGTTLMAGKHEASFVDFKSFLSVYGGRIFDDQLKPVFQNETGVQALQTYGDWIHRHKVTPPDVLDYTWDEAAIAFGFGQTAMGMNYHIMTLDPRVKSGQVGYFMFPGVNTDGNLVRGPHFGSWGIAVNRYSSHKQEAYELAQYLTSPEIQQQYLQYNQHVTRKSAYDASTKLTDATLREYYEVLGNSLSVGVGRPRITNYDEVSEAVQAAIHDYLTGRKDAKTALADGAERVEAMMKQAGYYD